MSRQCCSRAQPVYCSSSAALLYCCHRAACRAAGNKSTATPGGQGSPGTSTQATALSRLTTLALATRRAAAVHAQSSLNNPMQIVHYDPKALKLGKGEGFPFRCALFVFVKGVYWEPDLEYVRVHTRTRQRAAVARTRPSQFVERWSVKLGLLCTPLLPSAGQPSTLTTPSLKPSLSTHAARCTSVPPRGALLQPKLYTLLTRCCTCAFVQRGALLCVC